ncbi:apolipoprotein L3-like [Peromyscus californicus insignis]|uniref:apolipoprotein L3-like n=1 Tax=Peromyscus californicus insignis TaxID=564181 RepID=UPI0022A7638B|nr:apolipoprotein L3-like [Peromyscus californicus insignis]
MPLPIYRVSCLNKILALRNNYFPHALDLLCHSEQEDALHDALNKHLAQNPTDEDDETQRELQKKRFLEEFPELTEKLVENIRRLRDLADHIDQVHKDCTVSNVVADSTGTASGLLGILGLVLAPFTAGVGLALTATSVGLGAAAAATSFTTNYVETSNRESDEADAKKVVNASIDTLHDILMIIPKISVKLHSMCEDIDKDSQKTRQQLLVVKSIAGICRSFCSTSVATGISLARGLTAARGLNLVKGFKVARAGFIGVMLGIDIYNLVNSSMDLHGGATTESAGALRDLAQKLEEKLQEFEQIHKALQSDLFQ